MRTFFLDQVLNVANLSNVGPWCCVGSYGYVGAGRKAMLLLKNEVSWQHVSGSHNCNNTSCTGDLLIILTFAQHRFHLFLATIVLGR